MDTDETDELPDAPEQALRALANRKSERVLLDVATWLETKADEDCSPGLCRLIAMHYDLLAEHRDVASLIERVAQYRRRAAHWRLRAVAYGRSLHDCCARRALGDNDEPNRRIPQEDLT